jgi:hypothetical protein
MGLSVEVGHLANMLDDEQCADWFREDMARLNIYLPAVGLAPHQEPEDCDLFSYDLFGYTGLLYLRRIAAHLELRGALPPPGDEDAPRDPILEEYAELAEVDGYYPKTSSRTFDHLLVHDEEEGYYLPQDFAGVLCPPGNLEIPGGLVGSAHRLREECRRLAAALELPLELDPEAAEVLRATEGQGRGDTKWRRYGIESFVCLRLFWAAEHSLREGAAMVFC